MILAWDEATVRSHVRKMLRHCRLAMSSSNLPEVFKVPSPKVFMQHFHPVASLPAHARLATLSSRSSIHLRSSDLILQTLTTSILVVPFHERRGLQDAFPSSGKKSWAT